MPEPLSLHAPPGPASAEHRTEAALERITRENGRTRIVTAVDAHGALAAARAADGRAARGTPLGPLDGRLVAVKDNLAVRGLPWTAGVGAYRDRIADRDAAVVAALRRAGAVLLGTLNMHEGALGATSDNPHFGRCQNPLREGFTPGGSSGGSGAAAAAGLVDVALGTDTMGSVRIPAAYCGTYGLKPTDGSLDRAGLAFLCPTLDTIGPVADDPALLLAAHEAMAGVSRPAVVAEPAALRFAVPRQIAEVDSEPCVQAALQIAVEWLRRRGAVVETVDLAGWEPSRARRGGLLLIEAEAAAILPDLLDPSVAGVSADFRDCLAYGAGLSAARLVDALDRIKRAGDACRKALAAYDGLLLPTAPQRAFSFDVDPPPNQADFTSLTNFGGCPAVAMPVAGQPGQLPASVQIIGTPYSEALLCALARMWGADTKAAEGS
ncbi:aspartyl-tRNA(Asn)/glutamyl-tRNA(Gln) amidotransferase subunit A [Azospirillum brasilense]|uniref:Aspartyl-tRNA(Asn)/glutamyl-tRNA(Gln) amidotransferase subunit A n=1 Tax=Azospirillum brasilense TaxID=192 RepID=A0A560CDC6_AZOBR|nr:amidase [Azospirillum brasilense]TWA82858.1 aspartyl-tRNA(Asn)/glutamyl-tRNA(Gln) amidotransferase subunit A [Azospirillum brasilense]